MIPTHVVPHLQHDAQLDYYGRKLATCSSDRTIKVYDVSGDETAQSAELGGCVDRRGDSCDGALLRARAAPARRYIGLAVRMDHHHMAGHPRELSPQA